jgi:hypothetical protein
MDLDLTVTRVFRRMRSGKKQDSQWWGRIAVGGDEIRL